MSSPLPYRCCLTGAQSYTVLQNNKRPPRTSHVNYPWLLLTENRSPQCGARLGGRRIPMDSNELIASVVPCSSFSFYPCFWLSADSCCVYVRYVLLVLCSSLLSSHSGPATLLLFPNGWYLDLDSVISNGAGRSSSSPLLGTARVIEADMYLANHRRSQPEKSRSDTCLSSGGVVVLSPHASNTFQIWTYSTGQVNFQRT